MFDREIAGMRRRAQGAARRASQLIMQRYGKQLQCADKGLGSHTSDIVTEVDHACEALILEALFPGGESDPMHEYFAVLSEEMTDHEASERHVKPMTLVIDPLDGTRGYVERNGSFAVSIGLIEDSGAAIFGVASLPAHDQLYVGQRDTLCTINDERLTCPRLTDTREVVLWVSEAELFPTANNLVFNGLRARILGGNPQLKVRPACLGSPVQKGCMVAGAGQAGVYLGLPRPERGVSLWDFAAIVAIVEAAGGWASDVYGQPLELNRVGSTYLHHRGFVLASCAQLGRWAIESVAEHWS